MNVAAGGQAPPEASALVTLLPRYHALAPHGRRAVQTALCRRALQVWEGLVPFDLRYRGGTGSPALLSRQLPRVVLAAVDGARIPPGMGSSADAVYAVAAGHLDLPAPAVHALSAIEQLHAVWRSGTDSADTGPLHKAIAALGDEAPGALAEALESVPAAPAEPSTFPDLFADAWCWVLAPLLHLLLVCYLELAWGRAGAMLAALLPLTWLFYLRRDASRRAAGVLGIAAILALMVPGTPLLFYLFAVFGR